MPVSIAVANVICSPTHKRTHRLSLKKNHKKTHQKPYKHSYKNSYKNSERWGSVICDGQRNNILDWLDRQCRDKQYCSFKPGDIMAI